jgi:hypothetical protein
VGGEEEEYSNASGGGKAGPHGRAAPGKAGRGASAARFRLSPARPGPQAVGWWFGRRARRGLYHTALCCRGKCVEKGGAVAVRARACRLVCRAHTNVRKVGDDGGTVKIENIEMRPVLVSISFTDKPVR